MNTQMEYKGIIVSRNWGCKWSFEKLCNNAYFCFIAQIAGKERFFIVMNQPIEDTDIDLLEIGNDQYGIIDNGESKFNPNWGWQIIDSSKLITQMLKTYLRKQGASDLITDEPIKIPDI